MYRIKYCIYNFHDKNVFNIAFILLCVNIIKSIIYANKRGMNENIVNWGESHFGAADNSAPCLFGAGHFGAVS